MTPTMRRADEVGAMIAKGERLFLAGDESVLRSLPKGDWVGGTIPYFMTETGGRHTQDLIHATVLPPWVKATTTRRYDARTVENVYSDLAGGFGYIVIPANSATHLSFALRAPQFKSFASVPLIGWIAGVSLTDLGKVTPKVFWGATGEAFEDGALVVQATLADDKAAEVSIVNIFRQGSGDTLTFPRDGFSTREVLVNGTPRPFVDYIHKERLDTKLPLVADYAGAMVNVSFQTVDDASGEVTFYAPVFAGVEYKLAASIGDYAARFALAIPQAAAGGRLFSCNCILNYLYGDLEHKTTGDVTGPITFGEIAYQLLNQTLAYLSVHDVTA
jgi:hypothetical protein